MINSAVPGNSIDEKHSSLMRACQQPALGLFTSKQCFYKIKSATSSSDGSDFFLLSSFNHKPALTAPAMVEKIWTACDFFYTLRWKVWYKLNEKQKPSSLQFISFLSFDQRAHLREREAVRDPSQCLHRHMHAITYKAFRLDDRQLAGRCNVLTKACSLLRYSQWKLIWRKYSRFPHP